MKRANLIRAVLDTNAVDPIVDISGARIAILAAKDKGIIDLLYTHVTVDEILAVPDPKRRMPLLLSLLSVARLVPTGAFVLGYSRLGYARLGSSGDGFEVLRAGNRRHNADALIAATAQYEVCSVVTNDIRMAKRMALRGIEAITSRELFAKVGFTPPP